MSKASEILSMVEGASLTSIEEIQDRFNYFLDDFSNAIAGKNGSRDLPSPEAKEISLIIKEMKKSVAKLSKFKSEVWCRSAIGI